MNKFVKALALLAMALFFAVPAWAEEPATEESAPAEATVQDAPAALEITEITVPGSRTLGVGEKYLLPASYAPAEAENTLTYSSKGKKIASVDASGLVKARKAGKTKITASAASGVNVQCKIIVKAAPKSVSLNQTKLTLGTGQTFKLQYTLSKGSAGSASYSGYDASILSMDESGTVTALSPGTTKITVKTYNGKKASCKVTVRPAPASVAFDEASLTLGVGMRVIPGVTISAGSACGLTYETSDAAVATVDGDGRISAAGIGTATITARTHNGLSATCDVTVKAAPSQVALHSKKLTLGVKESAQLAVTLCAEGEDCFGSYAFSSGNERIATVSTDGKVTGKRAGTTTITVKTYNGKKATCTVTVGKAPASVSLNFDRLDIGIGETFRLKAITPGGGAGGVTWTSSNETALSVDANGFLTAKEKCWGVTVTAKTYNGKTATCDIYISDAPTELKFYINNPAVFIEGENGYLSAHADRAAFASLVITSSDPSVLELVPCDDPLNVSTSRRKQGRPPLPPLRTTASRSPANASSKVGHLKSPLSYRIPSSMAISTTSKPSYAYGPTSCLPPHQEHLDRQQEDYRMELHAIRRLLGRAT